MDPLSQQLKAQVTNDFDYRGPRWIGPAIKLEPGGIYVLEVQRVMSMEALHQIRALVDQYGSEVGVKFIVLTDEIRLAREHREGNDATDNQR